MSIDWRKAPTWAKRAFRIGPHVLWMERRKDFLRTRTDNTVVKVYDDPPGYLIQLWNSAIRRPSAKELSRNEAWTGTEAPEEGFNRRASDHIIVEPGVDMTIPGYERLAMVLQKAYDQAAKGKGKERHANNLPFHEQPMQSMSRLLGTEGGMAFQAIKKIQEARNLPTREARVRELLGAINYIAGMVIYEELDPPQQDAASFDGEETCGL